LGDHFDIHGGGLDLKFPHHENEIAQTCAATSAKFAEIWMHNGFLSIDNEKMSKSLGNFFTAREVMAKVRHPEVLRFFLLSSQYRGPMNYSPDQLAQAEATLNGFYTALRDLPVQPVVAPSAATTEFLAAMDDDFNTPEALAAMQKVTRTINSARDRGELATAAAGAAELRHLGEVLGLFRAADWFHGADDDSGMSRAEIEQKLEARKAARAAKDWATADRIRDELAAADVIFEDKPGGATVWRRK
ncbi:MAG TPA: DALR domain-containing protein, partial [Steroidobacteraceae bacterium]|nr:DALR domain-containing protein [Steroidobacteraceae bacterium]